jgi:hypothetical protein
MESRNIRTVCFLRRLVRWWLMHRPPSFFGLMWLTLQTILHINHPREPTVGWPCIKNCCRSHPSWNICGFGVVLCTCMNLMSTEPSWIQRASGALWLTTLMNLRQSDVIIRLVARLW